MSKMSESEQWEILLSYKSKKRELNTNTLQVINVGHTSAVNVTWEYNGNGGWMDIIMMIMMIMITAIMIIIIKIKVYSIEIYLTFFLLKWGHISEGDVKNSTATTKQSSQPNLELWRWSCWRWWWLWCWRHYILSIADDFIHDRERFERYICIFLQTKN